MIENLNSSQHSLHRLKPKTNEHLVPDQFKDIARGMESQFAEFMIQEMRKTVDRHEEESSAEKIYNSYLDNERAQTMTKSANGLGLQKMILEQIYPQNMRTQARYDYYKAQQQSKYPASSIKMRDAANVKETLND